MIECKAKLVEALEKVLNSRQPLDINTNVEGEVDLIAVFNSMKEDKRTWQCMLPPGLPCAM